MSSSRASSYISQETSIPDDISLASVERINDIAIEMMRFDEDPLQTPREISDRNIELVEIRPQIACGIMSLALIATGLSIKGTIGLSLGIPGGIILATCCYSLGKKCEDD